MRLNHWQKTVLAFVMLISLVITTVVLGYGQIVGGVLMALIMWELVGWLIDNI